ncbi:hypothetical protein D9758_003946 [Tetrapyrgos nigripes]|uniref:Sld7 C-terminal domain-containing protein n=1 Tax=Tetrapyrgos nigripes TaxID=182062 RepID=A0A8H5GLI4_9AGAR|nr:hypothetical protein D9758_003946 [Tetrapyrgos nigripes]
MSHRLLYRGALSVPDSDFLLDGLTFSARLDATRDLFENPLALALESMRRRPSLRLMGTVAVKVLHIDDSGEITVDIHPEATLSRVYFENLLCLEAPVEGEQVGLRVALGDTIGPETTQILIYLKLIPDHQQLENSTPIYALAVARILPGPPPSRPRAPRPDDPTPRKPPPVPFGFAGKQKPKPVPLRDLRRASSSSSLADLGSDVRLGTSSSSKGCGGEDVFKIPPLPVKNKDKGAGKGKQVNSGSKAVDVFGSISVNGIGSDGASASSSSGKRKRVEETAVDTGAKGETENSLERENKNRIKRAVLQELAEFPITKAHKDYKEVYNYVYRGVCFALRAEMISHPISQPPIDHFVKTHVKMYAYPSSSHVIQNGGGVVEEGAYESQDSQME